MDKLNIINCGISSMPLESKREFIYNLDYQLKYIHDNGGYIRDITPQSIYVDPGTNFPYFENIYAVSKNIFRDSEMMKKYNLLCLANLAICLYLPEYNLESGLLSFGVLSSNFEKIKTFIPDEDVNYYRNVLLENDTSLYYCDYIQKIDSSNSMLSSNAIKYVKSTPVGRAMTEKSGESGLINYVFITCVVFSLVILAFAAIFIYYN